VTVEVSDMPWDEVLDLILRSHNLTHTIEGTTMRISPAGGAPGWHSPDAQAALLVGGSAKPPTKTKDVRPIYPDEARAQGVRGVVILQVLIRDGKVEEAHVLRSISSLDQAALDAVDQWEFVPTVLNGTRVPVIITVTVNFTG
jgi:protein TonB